MLFPPEFEQRIRKPAAVRQQFMDDGVAGGTDRDQPLLVVNSEFPMVNRALVPCPTALTAIPIAQENQVADSGKVANGMSTPPVARGAEAGDGGHTRAIRAEERFLAGICHGHIIAADNEDYHY